VISSNALFSPSRSGQRQLVAAAMRYTGLMTKRAVIEEALRTLVRLKAQESVRSLRGQ
jgi:Arc/MetJ family transcription regulator